MATEKELEEEFDEDVTVERTTPDGPGRDGAVEFTVYCGPDSREEVQERVEELAKELAFETYQ